MARKLKDADFENLDAIEGLNSGADVSKMPNDVTGGNTLLEGYMRIPVNRIDPFSLKEGSVFSRPKGRFFERMVDTIKEVGVIEAVTVRVKENSRYELLAGETRWSAAKEAGERYIPAHVIDVDDDMAHKIYSLTNLMRRDLSVRDRINGWWHYYSSLKDKNALSTLRNDVEDEKLKEYVPSGDLLSYRQIMRYVQMHDLTSDWIDLMEPDNSPSGKPVVQQAVAEQVCKLSHERQTDILQFASKLTEESAKMIVKLNNGVLVDKNSKVHDWNTENIARIVSHQNLDDESDISAKSNSRPSVSLTLKKMKTRIMSVAQESLHPDDYSRAPEVIREALKLYYEKNG